MITDTAAPRPLTLLSDDEALFQGAVAGFAEGHVRPLVQQMERDAKLDPADSVDLLACLAAGSADDRALVTQAAKSHPTAFVRAAAVDLAKSAAAGPPAHGCRSASLLCRHARASVARS